MHPLLSVVSAVRTQFKTVPHSHTTVWQNAQHVLQQARTSTNSNLCLLLAMSEPDRAVPTNRAHSHH